MSKSSKALKPSHLHFGLEACDEGSTTCHHRFSHWSRRQLLSGLALGLVLPAAWGRSANRYESASSANGSGDKPRWMRVRTITELSGEVRIKDPRAVLPGAIRSLPVESTSTLDYEELSKSGLTDDGIVAFMKLHEAKVENRLNKHAIDLSVRPDCREVVRIQKQGQLITNCPDQPLNSKERDLIEGPIASLYIDELLPQKSLKMGESWEPSSDLVTRLFQLESIEKSTLKIKLAGVEDGKGQLELQGLVKATSHGVPTELNIQGKAQVDRKIGMISWLALSIEETRDIGEAEPGFKITARVRMLRSTLESPSSQETLESMEGRFADPEIAEHYDFHSAIGGYRLLAHRQWHVITDKGNLAVLKLVQANRLIAQCNIVCHSDLDAGQQLTLEGYQAEVRQSLAEHFEELEESSEKVTESGLRMLRVVAAGRAEGVPVQWIHINLSDDSGRRLTMAFTLNAAYAERFGGHDLQMASGLQLVARTATAKAPTAEVRK